METQLPPLLKSDQKNIAKEVPSVSHSLRSEGAQTLTTHRGFPYALTKGITGQAFDIFGIIFFKKAHLVFQNKAPVCGSCSCKPTHTVMQADMNPCLRNVEDFTFVLTVASPDLSSIRSLILKTNAGATIPCKAQHASTPLLQTGFAHLILCYLVAQMWIAILKQNVMEL